MTRTRPARRLRPDRSALLPRAPRGRQREAHSGHSGHDTNSLSGSQTPLPTWPAPPWRRLAGQSKEQDHAALRGGGTCPAVAWQPGATAACEQHPAAATRALLAAARSWRGTAGARARHGGGGTRRALPAAGKGRLSHSPQGKLGCGRHGSGDDLSGAWECPTVPPRKRTGRGPAHLLLQTDAKLLGGQRGPRRRRLGGSGDLAPVQVPELLVVSADTAEARRSARGGGASGHGPGAPSLTLLGPRAAPPPHTCAAVCACACAPTPPRPAPTIPRRPGPSSHPGTRPTSPANPWPTFHPRLCWTHPFPAFPVPWKLTSAVTSSWKLSLIVPSLVVLTDLWSPPRGSIPRAGSLPTPLCVPDFRHVTWRPEELTSPLPLQGCPARCGLARTLLPQRAPEWGLQRAEGAWQGLRDQPLCWLWGQPATCLPLLP